MSLLKLYEVIMEYSSDLKIAVAQRKKNKKVISKLAQLPSKKLDVIFHEKHTEVFEEIDCLSCANCCKTTSPIFRTVDIERLSKRLKISSGEFVTRYLKVDDDKDYVLQLSPCTFLMDDNKCSVYEDRPLACKEYPHTNRKKMHQILTLTRRNTEICPAVSRIFQSL